MDVSLQEVYESAAPVDAAETLEVLYMDLADAGVQDVDPILCIGECDNIANIKISADIGAVELVNEVFHVKGRSKEAIPHIFHSDMNF
jgi:hypothetical protein